MRIKFLCFDVISNGQIILLFFAVGMASAEVGKRIFPLDKLDTLIIYIEFQGVGTIGKGQFILPFYSVVAGPVAIGPAKVVVGLSIVRVEF